MEEQPGSDRQQIPRERIEESEIYKELGVHEPTWRERTASRVAYAVLVLFGVSLVASFLMGYYVLSSSAPGSLDERLVDTSLAYVKIIGGIFTPLLAFILGYYFTKKED